MNRLKLTLPAATVTLLLSLALPSLPPAKRAAGAQRLSPQRQLLFDKYKELVETNTTESVGNTTEAAEKVAARLRAAGFAADDVQVIVHPGNARKGNVVARLRGTGARKPILLLAHLDVVEAKKEDWSPDLDPFKLIERDGYFYGRGSKFDFPVSLNETTRAYFERMASVESGQTAKDMRVVVQSSGADGAAVARLSESAFYNASMRTTCVATRVEAGHANNALPQTARANVNCRILPQESPADI